jgi:hypothetical protein
VLSPARIEVEGRGVGDTPSRVIRCDGDVIAYLVLHRVSLERCEWSAHRHVGRPRDAAVGAKGIEQLRICVVRSIARVQPNRINSSIGCYCQCAKPVPFVMINRIVIDSVRRAKS